MHHQQMKAMTTTTSALCTNDDAQFYSGHHLVIAVHLEWLTLAIAFPTVERKKSNELGTNE